MALVKSLSGKVCIVTGATRGIGKGITLQLGRAGATVYITGRTLKRREGDPIGGSLEDTAAEVTAKGGVCIPVQCDHSKDDDIQKLFERVSREQKGQLDVLVNNAYSGVQESASSLRNCSVAAAELEAQRSAAFREGGAASYSGLQPALDTHLHTWMKREIPMLQSIADTFKMPFWEQDTGMWDIVNNVGLRNHYICSVLAARMMVPHKQGLIVNVSSVGGLSYLFNVAYGVGKEACDRMAADCGQELRKHQVAFVSLWPGLVRTEHMMHFKESKAFETDKAGVVLTQAQLVKYFDQGESPEYAGLAITHLAADPAVMKKSGRILMTGDLGAEYGFVDVDGCRRHSMRELGYILTNVTGGSIFQSLIPSFIKVPCWTLSLAGNKF